MAEPRYREATILDRVGDLAFRAIFGLAKWLPYERRVRFVGWLFARVLSPLTGLQKRIVKNLSETVKDLTLRQSKEIARSSANNFGRTFAEIYSGQEFIDRCAKTQLTGEGLGVLDDAHRNNEPVVLVTGHFGNYEAPRAALIARGFRIAGLYRPMNNAYFNKHYVEAMERIGPAIPRGKSGNAKLIRHMKSGGMVEFLIDQHYDAGDELTFFDRPALTATTAATLALSYHAPFVPFYGERLPDGIGFRLVVEKPIPHSTATEMTQALNDSLEARVREDLGQWNWAHRRWKRDRWEHTRSSARS